MTFQLSATSVKEYFQYRCERQLRYALVPHEQRADLQISQQPKAKSPWAQLGDDFEQLVVDALAQREPVLQPRPNEKLSAKATEQFLRRKCDNVYAHQLRLELSDIRRLLPDTVSLEKFDFSLAFPDLVQAIPEGEGVRFKLIDIKAVHVPTLFHKTQVAFYSLLLEAMLEEMGVCHRIDPVGEIWHLDSELQVDAVKWTTTTFQLKGYRAQVMDFLRNIVPRTLGVRVEPGIDETHFHVGYKCEQCKYLPHCEQTMADTLPRSEWDVSAVTGLSPASKQTLVELGVRTVGELAATTVLEDATDLGWGLRRGAEVFPRRAQVLLDGVVQRRLDRHTYLMPPHVDVGLYLLVDKDPIEGRLAALGYLRQQGEQETLKRVVLTRSGADAERQALLEVLLALIEDLNAVDAHNREMAEREPWYSHLFVYETSEARDLQEALGRHLDDVGVRQGLLDLIRMFPPEPLQPDPEYGGRRHLPATSLRSVFDSLYLLPVRVSQDLARVSTALSRAEPPLQPAYTPDEQFARPFSSRLNLDLCRALKSGQVEPSLVEADVEARLRTLAGMTRWILEENARTPSPFLHLKKEPFRWQTNFHPLTAGDLQVLEAQELLASRAAELAALTALADPIPLRKQRFDCVAPLTLYHREENPSSNPWMAVRLYFRGPLDCRQTTLGPGTFGVLLTDGDPEHLLDPGAWPRLSVSIVELVETAKGIRVVVDVQRSTWRAKLLPQLLERSENTTYCLDKAHTDFTTPRLLDFLQHLQEEPQRS